MSKTQRVFAGKNTRFHPLCYVTHLEYIERYTFGIFEYTSNVAAPCCPRVRDLGFILPARTASHIITEVMIDDNVYSNSCGRPMHET